MGPYRQFQPTVQIYSYSLSPLHRALTNFCNSFQGARLVFAGSPKNDDLYGDFLARSSAKAATANFPSNGLKCIQSAANQKSKAREQAFRDWDHEYQIPASRLFNDRNGLPTDIHLTMPWSTHHPPITTHSGERRSPPSNTWAVKSPSIRGALPPAPYNLQSTMPLPALTPVGFAKQTLQRHMRASVDTHFATLTISSGTAPYLFNNAWTPS